MAGLIALIKSMRPMIQLDELKEMLISGSVELGTPGKDIVYGYGFPDPNEVFNLTFPGGMV